MIISVSGIKRSGSTVQFNLIRIALEMAGYKVNICGHDYTPREVPEGEVDLVKRHPFSKAIAETADHIFLTDRDDEEILASLDRMWGSGDPERIKGMRKQLDMWKQYTDIPVFPYKYWEEDQWAYTRSLVYCLKVNVFPSDVLEEFNKIKPPKDKQDPVTLLFPGHITSK